jgi:hypothetical protein
MERLVMMNGFVCEVSGKPCEHLAITTGNTMPCWRCQYKLGVELNKVFTIKKGNRSAIWKIINHPFFDGCYAVISDHPYIQNGVDLYGMNRDIDHIASGASTFDGACKQAYDMT